MKRQGTGSGGWDNPIGMGHRIRILRTISKSSASGKGITITEISKKLSLSRQTVTSWVNKLLGAGRITKIRSKYFMTDDMVDDYWLVLANYLKYLLIMRVARFQVDPILTNWSNNDPDDIEDALFKIANRIGAFITFVLIEAMRPSKKMMSTTMRTGMSLGFIKSSISLDDLFGAFLNMLPDTLTNDLVLGTQMRKASHDRLSNAFGKIYPSIYKTIVEGYSQHLEDSQSSN